MIRKDVVILIHGFAAKDKGRNTTDKLKPYFARLGFKVIELDYRWRTEEERKQETPKLVIKLQDMVEHYKLQGYRVTVLGHSTGCEVAHLASLSKDEAEHAHLYIYLNASLGRRISPEGGVKHVQVYYSNSDNKPKNKEYGWGTMSKYGYRGKDKKVTNIDLEALIYSITGEDHVIDHFDMFKPELLKYTGTYVASWAKTILNRAYING